MPCRRVISDNIASPMPISPMIARFCVTLQLRRVEAITPKRGVVLSPAHEPLETDALFVAPEQGGLGRKLTPAPALGLLDDDLHRPRRVVDEALEDTSGDQANTFGLAAVVAEGELVEKSRRTPQTQ